MMIKKVAIANPPVPPFFQPEVPAEIHTGYNIPHTQAPKA